MDLDVGVFPAEDIDQFGQRFAGLVLVAGQQPFVDRAGDAAGQADDALGKLPQRGAIDAGFAVVEAFEVAFGDELGEVVPALVGLGEQGHVGGALAADDILLVLHGLRREVDFAAEDRFHPGPCTVL